MSYDIAFADNDFLLQRADAISYKKSFLLWIRRWKSFNLSTSLNWKRYPFTASSKNQIPDKPGVYAFCIEPDLLSELKPCYLIYVGETGDGKSANTLRKRFMSYIYGYKTPQDRSKIYTSLFLFKDYVHFWCAPVEKHSGSISTTEIEDELLRTFIPPDNTDLPVEVSSIAKALYS